MNFFQAIGQRISEWAKQENDGLKISGIHFQQWLFMMDQYLQGKDSEFSKRPHVLVCESIEQAEEAYDAMKNKHDCHVFLSDDHGPYSSILNSSTNVKNQFGTLGHLVKKDFSGLLITHIEAFFLQQPSINFFKDSLFELQISDVIEPLDLAKKLIEIGYERKPIADESGTFSIRGEIFDIYPTHGKAIRIQFFDELIELMHEIQVDTQKTLKDKPVDKIILGASLNQLCRDPYATNLRDSLPMPQPKFKNKFANRKHLLKSMTENSFESELTSFIPLFFKEKTYLNDYLPQNALFHFVNYDSSITKYEEYIEVITEQYNHSIDDIESDIIAPSPEYFYNSKYLTKVDSLKKIFIENLDISMELEQQNTLALQFLELKSYFRTISLNTSSEKDSFKENLILYLKNEFKQSGKVIICYQNTKLKNEIENIFNNFEINTMLRNRIFYINFNMNESFFYPHEKTLVISDSDLFARKKKKSKKQTYNPDLFAEQMATLKINDFVIHRQHGIGIYKGLESLDVGGKTNDFIVIHYQDDDKVFLPVYKINLIQKQASSESETKIASLKSKKFSLQKNKIKKSIKKLAFDLIELQAQRKLQKGFMFSPPDEDYSEFELNFPFQETPDQEKAINDVINDMQSQTPMDRLICGDVGFGKTEVAMRATFKAVSDNKQVALLVPTTVLALQHYENFKKRFSKFAVNVDFLSRFKTAKENKETLELLEQNKVDIIIGTHKLLSKDVKFHDLGLIIIDEEHRFGVGHKEKLKLLKNNVDCLTMTATPIPRTLQLSFLGIRDLSLVQTPPPRRQSIKTFIIKEDKQTLKEAIEKEFRRDGQVFFVHNRVQDIEMIAYELQQLVPRAKITIGHGQMNERELERKIKEFYSGKTNILLSTTIIESGIDIPTANTMIINRADRFGLAQLHQLRGRIGRADRKAYAYLVIPKDRILTNTAQKRLKALQTFAEIGSGFAIASSDLEIRGAGDIVGAEQSGHINQIGLELYTELLNEAVADISGDTNTVFNDVEIQTSYSAFIPEDYIVDSGQRLKNYKKLANCKNNENLMEIKENIQDVYGKIPLALDSLIFIIELRNMLSKTPVRNLKVLTKKIIITFDRDVLNSKSELRNQVLDFFLSRPKIYKINPNYTAECLFKETINKDILYQFAQLLSDKFS